MTREFDDLVDGADLTPEERRRLEASTPCSWRPARRPSCRRRCGSRPHRPPRSVLARLAPQAPPATALALIAAALALGCFGVGYAVGDGGGDDGGVVRTLGLEGLALEEAEPPAPRQPRARRGR